MFYDISIPHPTLGHIILLKFIGICIGFTYHQYIEFFNDFWNQLIQPYITPLYLSLELSYIIYRLFPTIPYLKGDGEIF